MIREMTGQRSAQTGLRRRRMVGAGRALVLVLMFLSSALSPLLNVTHACDERNSISAAVAHHQHAEPMMMASHTHAGSADCVMPCCHGAAEKPMDSGGCLCAGAVCSSSGLAVPVTVALLSVPTHESAQVPSGSVLPDAPVPQVPTPPPRRSV